MTSARGAAASGVTDALWASYRATGDPAVRAKLLDGYLGLVHHAARETARRGHDMELDDMIGAGTLGLVQALEGFDPSRGLAFSTYAMPRIRGAILDELRGRDWMPRSVRTRARRLAQARARLQQELGREPVAAELAASLGIDLETCWRRIEEADGRVMLALDQAGEYGGDPEPLLAETIADTSAGEPGDALQHEQTLAGLREAFAALPERERLVLTLYYYEELNLKQIGEVFHVSESRVSQIRTRALGRLRPQVQPVEEPR